MSHIYILDHLRLFDPFLCVVKKDLPLSTYTNTPAHDLETYIDLTLRTFLEIKVELLERVQNIVANAGTYSFRAIFLFAKFLSPVFNNYTCTFIYYVFLKSSAFIHYKHI